MAIINKIEIKNHPVLKNFIWENIPSLAVITGINGCGKTKFLDAINEAFQETQHNNAAIITNKPKNEEFGYVRWQQNLGGFEQGYYHNMMNDLQNFKQRILNNQLGPNYDVNIWRIYTILKNKGLDARNQQESYFEQNNFISAFREAWVYGQDLTFSRHIGRLFINYAIKENELIVHSYRMGTYINAEQIIAEIGIAPWELINQLFARYGFKYQVEAPNNSTDPYNLRFILNDNHATKVHFEALSSGEQMIVMLIFWSFDTELAKLKTFLVLDEPDAHLHPEMALMFKNILCEILVEKYKMQIFITTHSPTTLCWIDEEYIFLMHKENGVIKSTKSEALDKLTSGLVFVHPAFKIILVEGDVDQKFYQKIFDSLVYSKTFSSKNRLVFKSVETPKINSGGKTNVVEVCSQWQKFSTTTEIAGLINGLVDKDKDDNLTLPSNVVPLDRYCFENYLSDPLIIFCLLVEENDENIIKYARSIGYDRGQEYRFAKAEVGNEQNIVDFIVSKIHELHPSILTSSDIASLRQIEFVNGIKVNVPEKILTESGKDFWFDLYRKTFATKQGRINHYSLQDIMIKTQLIPKDLLTHLENLAN